MIEIKGSKGGGQILRTSLTLSALEQKPFSIKGIRGSRTNPGLKNQHLEAVKAVQRITDAEVKGASIGSEKLDFKPRTLKEESFTVNIGTAGSIMLLMDTLLPLAQKTGLRVKVKGGTDVKWSPTAAYLKHVKLPFLKRKGLKAELNIESTGYYPKGEGKAILKLKKSNMKSFSLNDRGELQKFEIYSKSSKELEKQNVADRQADEAARLIKNSHIDASVEKDVSYVPSSSPGSTLLVKAVYENSVAGFDVLGEKGRKSEEVAKDAVQKFKKFHASEATVDNYMADQLITFLPGTKTRLNGLKPTNHVQTNLETVRKFGYSIEAEEDKKLINLQSRE